ncbi:peptidylprolyl isomerase [Reichenbachiella versicolor]|uniref:peptidylprolyl isomerase n=1 Tax=Reichenbachiella versicolor TaxID=1821036 RepID=UPI000D6E3488|nr:peptidylprolyl isomerase [Reichenbachiella versicolor]
MNRTLLLLLLTTLFTHSFAKPAIKDKSKVTLFNIGNDKHDLAEFEYYFLKNSERPSSDSASQKVNDYLKLYIDFRLKVKEARSLKMDQEEGFIKELNGYKEQLIEPYLLTSKINNEQVKETYERMLWEVSGSHILLKNKPNATPEDTLEIYDRLLDIKKRIEAGEDFGKLAKQYSDDKSALKNNGYLGYFSALQMVYPFENAAYSNQVGSIVGPFTTRFGYHILRVEDKRPARGQALTAHIMIRYQGDETAQLKAKEKAESIYQNLMSGKDWDEQCALYSDDQNTAKVGGKLRWFGTGNLVPEFEDAAFSLKKGEISKPVKTQFGWHIIKLLDKKSISSLEEQKSTIEKRISRDGRSKIKKETAIKRLKKEHEYILDTILKNQAFSAVDSTLLTGQWEISKNDLSEKSLITIGKKKFPISDFWAFVVAKQKPRKTTTREEYLQQLFDQYEEKVIFDFEKEDITVNNQEYKMILDEYRSGILLFNLMEKKVWNKAIEDTTGLKKFYESNKEKYILGEHALVRKFVLTDTSIIESIIDNLHMTNQQLDSIYNKEKSLSLQVSNEKVMKGDNTFIDKNWKEGIHIEKHTEYTTLWSISEIKKKGYKELKETRGLVISDYQSELEQLWLDELRKKYPIKVSKSALKKYTSEFE